MFEILFWFGGMFFISEQKGSGFFECFLWPYYIGKELGRWYWERRQQRGDKP